MDYTAIELKRQSGVTWLVFNRPEKKNAMNPTLHREMHAALSELEQDAETHVLSLRGRATASARERISRSIFMN